MLPILTALFYSKNFFQEVEVTLRGKFKIGLGQQILGINNMETHIITVKKEK